MVYDEDPSIRYLTTRKDNLEPDLAGFWVFLASFLAGGGIKLSLNLAWRDSG